MITMSKNLTKGALAIATGSIALASFAGAASAASLGGGMFSNALQTTEINQSGILPKADPGTLTKATLKLTGSAIQAFTGSNTAAQAQTANLTSSVDLLYTLPAALGGTGPLISLSETSGFLSYAVGQTRSFGPFSDSDTLTLMFDLTNPAALAFLTGPGSFSVSCESFSGFTVQGGGGNIATTQATQAGCGAMISYEGEPVAPTVPEPSAILGLLGVAGLGAFARRRRS